MSDISDNAICQAAALLKKSRCAVALTGAGVSTESGIPDFRSAGGLWSRFSPEEYGTLGAFLRNPEKTWRMLDELLDVVNALPNAGHLALAGLEKTGILKGIITQNIDGLHQKAGSNTLVEFHGSFDTFSCLACGGNYPLTDVRKRPLPGKCQTCGALLKPDIVFFDEQIPQSTIAKALELTDQADVLLVAGTSCQVMPAAALPSRVARRGGHIIELNLEPALIGISSIILKGKFAPLMQKLHDALTSGTTS